MLQNRIEPKSKHLYATHVSSRRGREFKTHKTLSAAKQAISLHHFEGTRSSYVASNPARWTNGLYRWNNDGWDLIFAAHPGLSKSEVSGLLKCIKDK